MGLIRNVLDLMRACRVGAREQALLPGVESSIGKNSSLGLVPVLFAGIHLILLPSNDSDLHP